MTLMVATLIVLLVLGLVAVVDAWLNPQRDDWSTYRHEPDWHEVTGEGSSMRVLDEDDE